MSASKIDRKGARIDAFCIFSFGYCLTDLWVSQVQYSQRIINLRYCLDSTIYVRMGFGIFGEAVNLKQRVAKLSSMRIHDAAAIVVAVAMVADDGTDLNNGNLDEGLGIAGPERTVTRKPLSEFCARSPLIGTTRQLQPTAPGRTKGRCPDSLTVSPAF